MSATAAAASAAEASAVWTFSTSTASFVRVGEQHFERVAHSVAASASPMMSTGLDCDQVGGRIASRRSSVSGDSSASTPPKSIRRSIGEHADAAAIGEDRQALAGDGVGPGRASRRRRTARRGRGPAAGRRGGRRRRRPRRSRRARRYGSPPPWRAWAWRPALIDDHRLGAGGGARRRHELARVLDRLDVEQDRAGAVIEGEIVEQVAEIDVELVADRGDGREADRRARAAHSIMPAAMRAGLRDEREVAGAGHAGGEGGVELGARHHDAEAVRADEAQPAAAGGRLACLGDRARPVAEAGGDDDRRRDPAWRPRRR